MRCFALAFFSLSILALPSQVMAQDVEVSEREAKIRTYITNSKQSLPFVVYQDVTWQDTRREGSSIVFIYKLNTNAQLNNTNPSIRRQVVGELLKKHCANRKKEICRLYSHVFNLDQNVKIVYKDITDKQAFNCNVYASECSKLK